MTKSEIKVELQRISIAIQVIENSCIKMKHESIRSRKYKYSFPLKRTTFPLFFVVQEGKTAVKTFNQFIDRL